jgi:hypothetical protein
VNLAELYPDSKTFVDKPTAVDAQKVVADFNALGPQDQLTVGAVSTFVTTDFVRALGCSQSARYLTGLAETRGSRTQGGDARQFP